MIKKNTAHEGGKNKSKTKLGKHNIIGLSPTQKRIVKLLLIKPEYTFDLEQKACCRYAADNICKVRAKGIGITTELVKYIREDGLIVRMGRYSIDADSIGVAKKAVSRRNYAKN
jgi:hypothetical protein